MTITQKPSPNYTSGRNWQRIKLVVIHWVGQGTADSAAAWFANDSSNVSAHYIVGDSVVYQCVAEKDTAWHSGNWDVNLESIGIEHEATPDKPATENVYKKSAELIKTICEKYSIPIDREHIIGHNEVKATACPGTIDIDKLISLAKGEQMDCEKELDEMRLSRNGWRDKAEELENKLLEESTKHAEEIGGKNQIIEQYSKQVTTFDSRLLEKDKTISDTKNELERWRTAYTTLEGQYKDADSSKTIEIIVLNNKLADSKVKIEKLSKPIRQMTLVEFIKLKYRG
jgi:N-acetyl-anhydromuramyl-L-alanine amidase AmpD